MLDALKLEMRQFTVEMTETSKNQINTTYDKRIGAIESLQERLRLQLRAAEEQIVNNSLSLNMITC